jgi:catechol 2,3-dioxygenase-like lactoylglutathione lyase family enzyme
MLIDHISLAVSDLERSSRFYDAALAPLGIVVTGSRDLGRTYSRDRSDDFSIHQAMSGAFRAPRESHYAFAALNSNSVDAFYAAALANGGKDDGAPGLRPIYHPGYYAAFVLDPDGHRIEAVFHDRKL